MEKVSIKLEIHLLIKSRGTERKGYEDGGRGRGREERGMGEDRETAVWENDKERGKRNEQ